MIIGLRIAIFLTVLYTISFTYAIYDLNKMRKTQAERCIELEEDEENKNN